MDKNELRAMVKWLGHWTHDPKTLGLKPLGGSKVDSVFHPLEVDQMSTTTSWVFVVKSTLSLRSGCSLETVELHP